MIIGLMGQKHSGKDTVGAYLVKEHKFERRAFADPMKHCLAGMLDIDYSEIDHFKNKDDVHVTIGYKTSNPVDKSTLHESTLMVPDHMWSPIREQTFRQFIQRFAESHKLVLGDDVWTNLTLPVDGYYNGRAIVITDVRFTVEHQRIKDLGGTIIRVVRNIKREYDDHPSEIEQLSLQADHTIQNDADITGLYANVERLLENL
jgi:hypothetical protein